jgi:hypothetical protein
MTAVHSEFRLTRKNHQKAAATRSLRVRELQYGDVQPRKADFRKNLRLSNQTLFQFEEEALEKELGETGTRFHLILGHGYQELDFVQIGAPKPDGDGYIGETGNIMDEIRDTRRT